jgi:hypothetical protein
MPYRISFDLVIARKDQSIHSIPTNRNTTVCGIDRKDCFTYVGVAKLAWCEKCRDAYQTRSEKEFINTK